MKGARRRRLLVPSLVVSIGCWSSVAWATCISPTVSSIAFTSYIEFPAAYESGTYPDNTCSSCDSALSAAMQEWNTTCEADGIPRAVESAPSDSLSVRVDVFFQGANTGDFSTQGCGGDRCGCAFIDHRDGQVIGGLIRMFKTTSTGTDCTGNWSGIMTHELGHAFGLDDVSAGCENFIMGNIQGGVGINGYKCAEIDASYDTSFDDDSTISGDKDHPCGNQVK